MYNIDSIFQQETFKILLLNIFCTCKYMYICNWSGMDLYKVNTQSIK